MDATSFDRIPAVISIFAEGFDLCAPVSYMVDEESMLKIEIFLSGHS